MNRSRLMKVALLSLTFSTCAYADIYSDIADINRSELLIKVCGFVAVDYSSYSKWVSDSLEYIYKNSKPNSKQRDALLKEFMTNKQESDDKDYLNRKKIYEIYKDNQTRADMLFQVMTFTRMKAYSIAVESTGLSKISYQAQIEQECKFATIRQ